MANQKQGQDSNSDVWSQLTFLATKLCCSTMYLFLKYESQSGGRQVLTIALLTSVSGFSNWVWGPKEMELQ